MKRFVEGSVKHLAKIMGVSFYDITIRYRYDKKNEASVVTEPEYERAQVNINLEAMETPEQLKKAVLHEMAHIPSWQLYHVAGELARNSDASKFAKEMVRHANEAATTAWARILEPLVFGD